MTRKPVVFITGAGGEIGHGLIARLAADPDQAIITLDLNPLDKELQPLVRRHFVGSILDGNLLETIQAEYQIELIFHLAALLSTRSEFAPMAAHRVNVEGTMAMLEFAVEQGNSHGRSVTFMYPSSIAAYGFSSLESKQKAGRVREDDHLEPTTMYGCNKLYCEILGAYYAKHYKQLAAEGTTRRVDFRGIRFPGLISALTLPSGGTSDYAPEMLHAAAQGQPYACFVRPDTRIPFMAMPDAIEALMRLAAAPARKLSRAVYNIGAFNPSADEVRAIVLQEFPKADITYMVDTKRQGIVDSWPEDVDDSAARWDWDFSPKFDLAKAFNDYLIPTIKKRYT